MSRIRRLVILIKYTTDIKLLFIEGIEKQSSLGRLLTAKKTIPLGIYDLVYLILIN